MNMLKMLIPMVSKMLPKIKEQIQKEPLNKDAGEFQRVIIIDLDGLSKVDEDGNEVKIPLQFYVGTLAKSDVIDKVFINKLDSLDEL